MRVVCIIQARMGSTRLPGKVLMDLGGTTVLERVVRRVRRSVRLDGIVVATTALPMDDVIVRECEQLSVTVFRGSEHDVLDRYHRAARVVSAEIVVRITSDCPLIDPELIDRTIAAIVDQQADYASNILPRTFPRGLDVEAFTARSLDQAWREARECYQREHVTPYFYENPGKFRQASVRHSVDCSQYRWTLDTSADLNALRAIYAELGNRDDFYWTEVLALMQEQPELAHLNAQIEQKALRAI